MTFSWKSTEAQLSALAEWIQSLTETACFVKQWWDVPTVKSCLLIQVTGISLYANLSFCRGNNMPETPSLPILLCEKRRTLSCLPVYNFKGIMPCWFAVWSFVLAAFLFYLNKRGQPSTNACFQSWRNKLKKKKTRTWTMPLGFTMDTTNGRLSCDVTKQQMIINDRLERLCCLRLVWFSSTNGNRALNQRLQ